MPELNGRLRFKAALSALTLLIFSTSYAQKIHWAGQIIDISSEYSSTEFGAPQVLGEPDAIGLGTKRSNAWLPQGITKDEFIMVSFDEPIKANQIIIAEAEHPGAIKSIFLYDEGYYEYTQLEVEPGWVEDEARFFHQRFDETPFDVHAVRLVVDVTAVPGRNTIDAIGIANSDESIMNLLEKKQRIDPRNFKSVKLDEHVNSPYEENNPILSPDGKRLYFSRQFDPKNVGGEKDPEDIWYSDRVGDQWSPAKNLGAPWNTDGPNFICSISVINGSEVFLLGNVYANGKMYEGVSMATKTGENYGIPEKIVIENFFNYSNIMDFYLVNENTLLMAVARDDGFGKRDIFVSNAQSDGTWSKPKNLGPTINTFEEEGSPQMDEEGRVIYFSSKGFNGYGGLDVYYSNRLDDTWENWSTPLNMGAGVNGGGDESYFSLSKDETEKFYSRGDTLKPADIYHISIRPTMIQVSGRVLDADTNEPIGGAIVNFQNRKGEEYFTVTDDQGDYTSLIPGGRTWTATPEFIGYRMVSALEFDLTFKTLTVDNLLLEKVAPIYEEYPDPEFTPLIDPETAQSYDIKYFLFDFNSSQIQPGSYSDLQNIVKYLQKRKELRVEIHGHADSRSTEDYNMWLSERRANRIAGYLMNYDIDGSRISVKAHGEKDLINDCGDDEACAEWKHAKNRRTEIRILGD